MLQENNFVLLLGLEKLATVCFARSRIADCFLPPLWWIPNNPEDKLQKVPGRPPPPLLTTRLDSLYK